MHSVNDIKAADFGYAILLWVYLLVKSLSHILSPKCYDPPLW